MLSCAARPCTSPMFCPVSVGIGIPAAPAPRTGLVTGHDVPEAGDVPATVPTGTAADATFSGAETWSPARRRVDSASLTDCPVTGGTVTIFGPAETVSMIVVPLAAR